MIYWAVHKTVYNMKLHDNLTGNIQQIQEKYVTHTNHNSFFVQDYVFDCLVFRTKLSTACDTL